MTVHLVMLESFVRVKDLLLPQGHVSKASTVQVMQRYPVQNHQIIDALQVIIVEMALLNLLAVNLASTNQISVVGIV